VPQETTTAPTGWKQNPYVQVEGGFVAGAALGSVPFAGVGQQALDAAGVLSPGTPEARRGVAVGQIFGGVVTLVGGLIGDVLGGVTSGSGVGAPVGVPAMVLSTGLVVGGAGNIAAGIRGLLTTGSGSVGPSGKVTGAELEKKRAEFDPRHAAGARGGSPRSPLPEAAPRQVASGSGWGGSDIGGIGRATSSGLGS